MKTLTLQAPAKLNLFLRVCNKRPDGYHNIETIFEKIDLCDTLTLAPRAQGIKVVCRRKSVPSGRRNLCYRAAQALLAHTHCPRGVEIIIRKRIPVAAGLGGGSSDAASALIGINILLGLNVPRKELFTLAQGLGADVPFFIIDASRAVGRGKGEILTPVKVKAKNWYVLALPKGLEFSTRAMYQHPKITLTKRPYGAKIILCALEKNDLTAFGKYSYNSFEGILHQKNRTVFAIKKALSSLGVRAALMSGSGPCVFGVVASGKEAQRVSKALRKINRTWQVIVARTNSKRRTTEHGNHRG
ncbi:MAG: 4-(cytidine 5'-diphospho)-2-C-methyl-D-erythritol kinase [Candidatus Omnitrophota bacterium]